MTGTRRFLAPATARTKKIWEKLTKLFVEERKKGVLDISQMPSSITAHAPGYIDKDTRSSSASRPRRRSSAPSCRTAASGWCSAPSRPTATTPDPHVVEAFTKYRKTHNEGVFDAYTADIRRCRSSHVLTGSARRLWPRADHRRLPARGALRRRPADRAEEAGEAGARPGPSTEDIIRDREELSEQIRALEELKKMAASYGFDISGPAAPRARPCSGSTSATSPR